MAYTIDIADAPKGTYAQVKKLLDACKVEWDYAKPIFTFNTSADDAAVIAAGVEVLDGVFLEGEPSSSEEPPSEEPVPAFKEEEPLPVLPSTTPTPSLVVAVVPTPAVSAPPPSPVPSPPPPLDLTNATFSFVAGDRRVAFGKVLSGQTLESLFTKHNRKGRGTLRVSRNGSVIATLTK
jgi:hypothetical protein